jgi:Tol biopolymer transport system component
MRLHDRLVITLLSLLTTLMVLSDCFAAPPIGRFIDAKTVPGINISTGEDSPVISADGLELFFDSSGAGASDLRVATRLNRNDPFQTPTIVQGVNSAADEDSGSISQDGLTLYFGSNRGGNYDLYQATRANRQSPFGNVTSLGAGVNTAPLDNYPFVSPDGFSLYYHRSTGAGGGTDHRLWTATRASTVGSFANPQDLGAVVNGSPTIDSWRPTVSADGRTLFFSDGVFGTPRPGGKGGADIWVASRDSTADPFGAPVNLNNLWPGSNVNSSGFEGLAYISPDWPAVGSKLYFTTNRGGATNGDIWEATWVPEPATFTLGLLACAWLIAFRRSCSNHMTR